MRAAIAQEYRWDTASALMRRASYDNPTGRRTRTRIRRPPRASVACDVARNLQPQAARKEPECPQGALLHAPPKPAAPFVGQSPGRPIFKIQTARVAAPTRGRLAAPRAIPGRPVAAPAAVAALLPVVCKYLSLVRSAAPGAAGFGVRRANAALCDWWARRGARSGHGRAFKKFAAAAGCAK